MTIRKVRLSAAASALVLAVAPIASAGWASLGDMSAPQREGNTLVFRNAQGTVAVSVVAPEIVRVRFAPTQVLGRDHSYAVVTRDFGDPRAAIEIGPDASSLRTAALRVTLRHAPFRVSIADGAGEALDEDDPERGIGFAGSQVKVWKRLRPDEHVYGLGEKSGRLDKRGSQLGGSSYAMWTTDAYGYGDDSDPLYLSVPFYMILRNGRAHGVFLDNTHRSFFDLGHESEQRLAFGAEGGELDYYFILGPSPRQVVERYTALTGRMPLPPLWALGFHQCRYSYYPEAKVRFIADNFRVRRIPADVIWLDIHHLDGYNPLTWDRERFPDPARMLADLRRQGFRVISIVDPHPKKQPGWDVYDSGLAGGHFVKNPDGSVFEGPVWPSNAERNPGPSVFPDFSKPAARDWWGGLYKRLTDVGVAGIWNDMNEPAAFIEPFHTLPQDLRHDGEGEPTDQREIHNVYGQLMTRSTYEGLLRLQPDKRPFVLTRASFAGGQRFAAAWPGDNTSDWSQLRASIPMLLGMGLSGFAFVGSDIGGFAGAPSPELVTRWVQLAVFYPFMRMHAEVNAPDREPWSYGIAHEQLNRRAIELRYRLLPHIYGVMREASQTGVPAMRPLFLEFPDDARTYALNDQFLFGRDLLVAPVVREGAGERSLYLPAGDWYDFWTGRRHQGGRELRVPVTLESIPVFARAGAFVFQQPVVQHTDAMAGQPLEVVVYPAAESSALHYEDDGESRAYLKGAFRERRFAQRCDAGAGECRIEVGAVTGSLKPDPRELRFRIAWDGPLREARVGDQGLRSLSEAELDREPSGFAQTDGWLIVKLPDRPEAFQLTLEP